MAFDIPLPPRVVVALNGAGIDSTLELLELNLRQLSGLAGVGPRAVDVIVQSLAEAGLDLAPDPWAPYVCARHNEQAGDAHLAGFYLCESCRHEYVTKALSERSPEWISEERIHGYCAHCNVNSADIRLTQWFMCGVCERVLRSIGRGLASAKYVLEVWERERIERHTRLQLIETDPPLLRPRGQRSDVNRVSLPDFMLLDRHSSPVAGLELKSGPKAASKESGIGAPMARFQLDTTDCDDICTVVEREGIPLYVLHVQVIGRAEPPTQRYCGVGMWWVDLWTMSDNFKSVEVRSLETRNAAYYRTSMFRGMEEFVEFVRESGIADDSRKLRRYGLPPLY